MTEYEIYNRQEGLETLHINVFESEPLIKVTMEGPIGYQTGTMLELISFLEEHNIDSNLFNLQVDISGGNTANQISVLEDAVADFENFFTLDEFVSVNIFDTFGTEQWGNATRKIYPRH